MQVSEIWRFPVKSLQGEQLEEGAIGRFGIFGDRAWSLVDAETGMNLTARREPDLLFARARLEGLGEAADVVITLPDGTETADDAALSAWLGRDVELRRASEDQAGTFETQADESETGKWYQWTGATGSFHDSTVSPVSLVTTDSFRDWDLRRFRINIILNGTGDVGLVHHEVRLGSATLGVVKQIDRCVMTTRPQPALGGRPALDRDLEVLRTINRENDTFLGVGSLVVAEGTIAVGDRLEIVAKTD